MATQQSSSSEKSKRAIGRPRKSDAGQSADELVVTINSVQPDGMKLSHFTDAEASVVCTLSIPNRLLYRWSQDAGSARGSNTYVGLLNEKVHGGAVRIKTDSPRIEKRLFDQAHKLAGKLAKAKGRRRDQLLQQDYTIFIFEGETESLQEIRAEVAKEVVTLQEEYELVKAEASRSKEETEALLEQMATLSCACEVRPNRGGIYENVSERQARRKLDVFKKQAQDALWFGGTFGLIPEYVQVRKARSGSPMKVPLNTQLQTGRPQVRPTEDDHTKLLQTLYISDQFAVSDEAYHELRMLSCDLPPLCQLKKARTALNNSVEIDRLPSLGAYRSFSDTLTVELRKTMRETNATLPIKVKLSGDGARLSRKSNLILLSFSLPGLQTNMLAASGNHTFAAIRTEESYDTLSSGLDEVVSSLNVLLENPRITIDGVAYSLEFFLGSDLKFLLLLLGLNAAHSNYACIWCDVCKDERWDMRKTLEEYTVRKARTLEGIKKKAQLPSSRPAKERCGVIHSPLLNIELHHVVVDELHLLLRISDVLIRNLIFQMVIQERRSAADQHHEKYLDKLEKAVREIGVTFRVWEVVESNGKRNGKYDCTSLMGNDKKKVMRNLPTQFATLIPDEQIATTMADVWIDFYQLYEALSSSTPPDYTELHTKAKQWVLLFLSLGDRCEGFQRKNVTPYIHILVYHVPDMVKRYGNIRQFSGQGVEKNNDVAKRNYFSSNLQDPAGEILKTEVRLEATQSYRRPKRKYVKQKKQYWEDGGIQESRKRRRLAEIQNQIDT